MIGTGRRAARVALVVLAPLVVAASAMLLALASVGVFATGGGAWTTEVRLAGAPMKVNVIGVVRIATLPGAMHLLDGRRFETAAGTIAVSRDGTTLRLRCAPCRVQHPELASRPVALRAVTLDVRRSDDRIDGTVAADGVRVAFDGRLRATSIDLDWRLAPVELAAVYRALGDAIPEAAFARIEGRLSADGSLSLPSRRLRVRWGGEGWEVAGLGTEQLQFGPFRFACRGLGSSPELVPSGEGDKRWIAADAMGPYLAAAVLAGEDQRFFLHAGVDKSAVDTVLDAMAEGRPGRGASTLTQQLARTLFTGGERTAARKLRELLYAIEMERTLGKGRILELYLNTVDWGPGVCGAKAAARTYFNKTPARLTPIEAAWLASILPHPHDAWSRQWAAHEPDREGAAQVLMQMRGWSLRERQRMAKQPLVFAPAKPVAGTVAAAHLCGGAPLSVGVAVPHAEAIPVCSTRSSASNVTYSR